MNTAKEPQKPAPNSLPAADTRMKHNISYGTLGIQRAGGRSGPSKRTDVALYGSLARVIVTS